MTLTPAEAAVCNGKEAFSSPRLAHAVTERKNGRQREVYRCRYCGFFHIGGRPAKIRGRVWHGA